MGVPVSKVTAAARSPRPGNATIVFALVNSRLLLLLSSHPEVGDRMAAVGRNLTIALHKVNVRLLERARGLAKFLALSLVVSNANHTADVQI